MTTIINLTPHDVRLFVNGVCKFVWPASQQPARAVLSFKCTELAPGIPIQRMVVTGVYDLPEPVDDTYLIVSHMVSDACPDRFDLIVPDMHPTSQVRDRFGELVGVRRFRSHPRWTARKASDGLNLWDDDTQQAQI